MPKLTLNRRCLSPKDSISEYDPCADGVQTGQDWPAASSETRAG